MFHGISTPARLSIALGIFAIAPAIYIGRYLMHSPSRRDITQPPEDVSWREPKNFALCSAALIALGALAIFVFTPTAAKLARLPIFIPSLAAGLTGLILYRVMKGLLVGLTSALSRGIPFGPYSRNSQPVRYWLSTCWNGFLCALLGWVSYASFADIPRAEKEQQTKHCVNSEQAYPQPDAIAACTGLIASSDRAGQADRALMFDARGYAYQSISDYPRATADYSEAIRAMPDEPYPYFNRAIIRELEMQDRLAIADWNEVVRLQPKNIDAIGRRGAAHSRTGDFRSALQDFDQIVRLSPNDARGYLYRGATYRRLHDKVHAQADLDTALRLDPKIVQKVTRAKPAGM